MAVRDALLPAAPFLTGALARDPLTVAVAASGGELRTLRARQVLYRPGRDLVVRYAATVSWHGREPVAETLLAGTTVDGAPEGTLPLDAAELDGTEIGVWRYPFDPALPGLATAVTTERVRPLLAGLLDGTPELRVATYRPTRRAVVRASVGDDDVYVKVVRPRDCAALVARHQALTAAGVPVPAVLAHDEPAGLVVLRALPGDDLRDRLRGAGPLPDAAALLAALDGLQAADLGVRARRRPDTIADARGHAALLATVVPAEAHRLGAILDRIDALEGAEVEAPPPVTVHGDFHEAQLRVDDRGRITGVLDVDGATTGDRVEDLATMLGHLATLALGAGDARRRIDAYARGLHEELARVVDPVALERRVAAAIVGLATGPFRVQQKSWRKETSRRIALAQQWVTRAERTRESRGERSLSPRS